MSAHVVVVLYVYSPGWLVCRLLMYIGSAVPSFWVCCISISY